MNTITDDLIINNIEVLDLRSENVNNEMVITSKIFCEINNFQHIILFLNVFFTLLNTVSIRLISGYCNDTNIF